MVLNVLSPSLTSHHSPPPSSSPMVPTIPCSFFQLVNPLPTSVCLSACHPRVMPLSQPLGALLTLCLPNHLGAGYGDELLTTAGQPVPHNHDPPDSLLTHLHGNGAGICFLSCVRCQPAPCRPSAPPPPSLHPPASKHPIKRQLEGVTWSGSVEATSH